MSEMLLCFFNNLIFREVFGKRISADGECRSSPFQDLQREVATMMMEFGAADLFPSMGWIDVLTGWRRKLDKVFEKMDLLLEEMISERVTMRKEGRCGDGNDHEDFLDVLLHLHAKKDDSSLTMSQVKAVLMVSFPPRILI